MKRVVRAGSPEIVKITGGDSSPCSAESSFRELDDVFLQTQTRIWLGEVLHIRFDEETAIADLLADGELLFQVSKVAWKIFLKKHVELKSSKMYIYERTSSGKSDGKYMPYPKVDSFLKICQILGLTGIDLFSPSDVVEKRDVRRVCMCIRSFSKKARLKNLNVPDFDIVTYTIAMPNEMVGGICRSLEKSHYSPSSSSGCSSPSSTELRKSLSGQNTLHYDSYSESDEAESAYTEVEFQTLSSTALDDAAKLSNIMEIDSSEGNLVVDGDISELQTPFRADTQLQIKVVDIERMKNFTSSNGHFPHYLDGPNVVDAEEENNFAQSSSSDSNITLEDSKEEYVNALKCLSPVVQTVSCRLVKDGVRIGCMGSSNKNSISEQDTVLEKIYETEAEVNAEVSNEMSIISSNFVDDESSPEISSNFVDDESSPENNMKFYSISDVDDQRGPSKVSRPSMVSLELEQKHQQNEQKTADEVEVSSEHKYADIDYIADSFSFPQVSEPKAVNLCASIVDMSPNNNVGALIEEASDINEDIDGKQRSIVEIGTCHAIPIDNHTISCSGSGSAENCQVSSCQMKMYKTSFSGNNISDCNGNGSKISCSRDYYSLEEGCIDASPSSLDVDSGGQVNNPVLSLEDEVTIGNDLSIEESSLCKKTSLNISENQLETEGEMELRGPQEKLPVEVTKKYSEKFVGQDGFCIDVSSIPQMRNFNISSKESGKQTTPMQNKISEKEVSLEREIHKNQGDALISDDVCSIKENEEADGYGKTNKELDKCEEKLMPKPNLTEKSKGKKLLKSIAGAMTLIGALFLVNHVRQRRERERNTESKLPQQNHKPRKEFPEQKKVDVVKPVPVYPGEKLKF